MTLPSLKHYLAISLCLFVLPVAVQSASAHRVNVFAWVDGDTIHVESKFSGGKKVKTGKVVDKTFKSGESVEAADVMDTEMQFLYADGEFWHFMKPDTFEQYAADEKAVGDAKNWISDGAVCQITL